MTQIFSQLGSHFSSRLFFGGGGFMCKISPPRVNAQFHHIPTHQVFMYVPGRVGRTTHVESSKEPHFTFKKKKSRRSTCVFAAVLLPVLSTCFTPTQCHHIWATCVSNQTSSVSRPAQAWVCMWVFRLSAISLLVHLAFRKELFCNRARRISCLAGGSLDSLGNHRLLSRCRLKIENR